MVQHKNKRKRNCAIFSFCRKINRVFHVWSMISSKYLCVHELNVIWTKKRIKNTKVQKARKRRLFEECSSAEFYVKIKHISREWKRQTARKDIKIKLNLKTCGKMKIYAHSARDEWKTEKEMHTESSVKNWILKNAFLP